MLFQKRVVTTKLDIYVFVTITVDASAGGVLVAKVSHLPPNLLPSKWTTSDRSVSLHHPEFSIRISGR